jgi:quinol monooxygenase YgiN
MSSQVTVIARLKAKPGMEAKVREVLLNMVRETHKEPGCLNYDLHVSSDDPLVFLFHENWESKEALEKHNQTPHLLNLKAIGPELFSEPSEVKLYELISQPKAVAVS